MNSVPAEQSEQMTRLRRLTTEAGLDPDEALPRAIEAALASLTDQELLAIILGSAPAPKPEPEAAVAPALPKEEHFQRFNLSTRLQHGVMAFSVIVLIITGLPLKFHDAAVSRWFMNLIGGIDVSSFIHRLGATGLIVVGAFHLGYIAFARAGRRDFFLLLPRWKDITDWILMLRYYLGNTQRKAQFGRFSYIEKFDYWAVYWGMVIMISSGSVLWFQDFFLRFLPKFVMDIATEAHSDEALLATLAIIIWHFYNVHFAPAKFPMSKVFINGRLTREEMEEEHPLELEDILKGSKLPRKPTPPLIPPLLSKGG